MIRFGRRLDHGLRGVSLAFGLSLALSLSGCAFLESSGSVSDSSGSVSDSGGSFSDSSKSSSGGGDQAYRDDVRDFTVALVSLNGRPDELRRGVAEIALGRGISDWEVLDSTYSSVGEGLARVDVSAERLLAYRVALAQPGSSNFDAIGSSYEASRP